MDRAVTISVITREVVTNASLQVHPVLSSTVMWEAGECTEQLQKFRKEFLIINRLKMTKVTIINQSDCSIAGPHQYILSIGPGIVPNFLE